jgi:hypothetical protein
MVSLTHCITRSLFFQEKQTLWLSMHTTLQLKLHGDFRTPVSVILAVTFLFNVNHALSKKLCIMDQ